MARRAAGRGTQTRQLPRRVPPISASRAFGQKSPLADADLDAFLAKCMSTEQWNTYSDAEKRKIYECFPSSRQPRSTNLLDALNDPKPTESTIEPNSTAPALPSDPTPNLYELSNPPINSSDVAADPYIRRATARFKRDLADGYYEKAWQDRARRAHQDRMQGKLDDYVEKHTEEMFCRDNEDSETRSEDELAQQSEDGEYVDKVYRRSGGTARPRKFQREE